MVRMITFVSAGRVFFTVGAGQMIAGGGAGVTIPTHYPGPAPVLQRASRG